MWAVGLPHAWPEPPRVMSYSVLREIEICPLRWSLRRAAYPTIWDQQGYPMAAPLATIEGQVVHETLERIVVEASEQGTKSSIVDVPAGRLPRSVLSEPGADVIGTLRRLGGITAVLESVLKRIAVTWVTNPRLAPRVREWKSELQRRLPVLRQRVQGMLADGGVAQAFEAKGSPARRERMHAPGEGGRTRALGPGVYAEVPLNNRELGWFGKADLLAVTVDTGRGGSAPTPECEITDFKTGVPREDHKLQLRIYALLFARDKALNPKGWQATRLKLVYPDHTLGVEPPATDEDLERLAAELSARTEEARKEISVQPPRGRPAVEACEWCDVKHMCDAYWSAEAPEVQRERMAQQVPTNLEVSVLSQRSPASWSAQVTAVSALGSEVKAGSHILIRSRPSDMHLGALLRAGRRVRILGGQALPPSEESNGAVVISLGRSSEVFVVGPPDHELADAAS